MSDGLAIIGTVVGLFLLTMVMIHPNLVGLPAWSTNASYTAGAEVNTGQLVVNEPRTRIVYDDRSDFRNSATNDDSNGEVIIANARPGYYATGAASVADAGFTRVGNNVTIDYGGLLLVLLLLAVAIVLFHKTMRKSRLRRATAYPAPRYRAPLPVRPGYQAYQPDYHTPRY